MGLPEHPRRFKINVFKIPLIQFCQLGISDFSAISFIIEEKTDTITVQCASPF
jgi:hypothetical protein